MLVTGMTLTAIHRSDSQGGAWLNSEGVGVNLGCEDIVKKREKVGRWEKRLENTGLRCLRFDCPI